MLGSVMYLILGYLTYVVVEVLVFRGYPLESGDKVMLSLFSGLFWPITWVAIMLYYTFWIIWKVLKVIKVVQLHYWFCGKVNYYYEKVRN